MKDNIELHPISIDYIKNTLGQYAEESFPYGEELWVEDPIIHLYATHDTRNKNGELIGFNDSLFCDVIIYDKHNYKKYKLTNKDGLDLLSTSVRAVRIFKDGSTMTVFYGKHLIHSSQAITVWKDEYVASLKKN